MPLVVSKFLGEVLDLVGAAPGLALAIAQLFGLGTELAPQGALRLIHVLIGVGLMHGEGFERVARTALGDLARLLDCAFQLAAQGGEQATHRITGPSLSLSSTC